MIFKTKKFSFIILVFLSVALCNEKSIDIHVMEFDNLDKNLRYNNLTRDLPNFIISEYLLCITRKMVLFGGPSLSNWSSK